MRYRVLPYRRGSKGARALANELGGLVLRLEGSRFVPRVNDRLINWGSSRPDARFQVGNPNHFNRPEQVAIASNKLRYFTHVNQQHPELLPPFWTSRDEVPVDAYPVVCRTVLNGHSGEGIVIASSEEELVHAPLYVKYINKKNEYRVHVGRGSVLAVQRKARRLDAETVNWQIRNHDNGFVFVRNGFVAPDQVTEAAVIAVGSLGLDFGAADVIYNDRQERAYVLEVNSAPGLEGQTAEDYARFFRGEEG